MRDIPPINRFASAQLCIHWWFERFVCAILLSHRCGAAHCDTRFACVVPRSNIIWWFSRSSAIINRHILVYISLSLCHICEVLSSVVNLSRHSSHAFPALPMPPRPYSLHLICCRTYVWCLPPVSVKNIVLVECQ